MPNDPTRSGVEQALQRLSAPLLPVSLSGAALRKVVASTPTHGRLRDRLVDQRHLAAGGMGEVYRAHDPVLGRDVAVKVMKRTNHGAFALRFAREAQLTAQLDHPNIVAVHDAELGEVDEPSYSMKLVSGATLTEILGAASAGRAHGEELPRALRQDALLDYLGRVCDAVAYAHEKGVVHRDIKPDNVMVGPHGEVYVMDWGLARVLASADLEVTEEEPGTLPGYALGTVTYMAPEQARGQEMGPACDQFALALILYEIICGRPARPMTGDMEAMMLMAAEGTTRPVEAVDGRRIPRELRAILRRATQPRPEHRYPSVRELIDDLRRFRANEPIHAAPDTLLQRLARWVSTHRESTVSLVLLLLLLLVTLSSAGLVAVVGGAGIYASVTEAREARVASLVSQVGSRAAALDQAIGVIHGQVESVVSASGTLLQHGDPETPGEILAPSVFASDAKPEDTAWSTYYDRPISTHWPDVVIAPGAAPAPAVAQARRLLPIRHALRDAHIRTRTSLEGVDEATADADWRSRPGPIRWAILGTPEGFYVEMPGAAWDASTYDARERPWYTQTTDEPRPQWSQPYPETTTGTFTVGCSMQIRGDDDQLLGVASLSVSFTYLADRFLQLDHPAVQETFLVDDRASILMRSNQVDPLHRPDDLHETYETPPFPDPELAPALGEQGGTVATADGHLLLHYPLQTGWWFVAKVDPSVAASG